MSIQDMIKKSVLESGVFDSFNAPKMAISLIVALLLGAVIYMVYVGRHDTSHLHGYSGNQYEYRDFPWYGRCIVYRTFPYGGEGSDGSALSFLGDHDRYHDWSGNVSVGTDCSSGYDHYDLSVLS